MKKIILWVLCCIMFNPTKAQTNHTDNSEAQQNYEKAYKKTRSLTNTNPDSAMIWAEKCLHWTRTSKQKYKAHYLRGFNARKLGMYKQAIYDYIQARDFTTDSTVYFKVTNSLANAFLDAGKLNEAIRLNRQSIEYNKRNEIWAKLSYAYEVKSNILRKQKDEAALSVLQKALRLREKHVPKEIGYVYERMAKAFATFGMLDSAVKHQDLAIKHYPIKSSYKIATLHTQLAKYLITNKQTSEALPHLQKAQKLKKTLMAEFFWNHTFGLYLVGINANRKAYKMLTHCDILYQNLLAKAPDIVTRRIINECGKELYEDFEKLKNLQPTERKLYDTKLKIVKVSLASDELNIKQRDKLAEKGRQLLELKKAKTDSLAKSAVETGIPKSKKQVIPRTKRVEAQHYPTLYWLLGLGMVAGLVTWGFKIYRVTRVKRHELTPGEYNNMVESKLINTLTEDFGAKLSIADEEIIKLYFRGTSYDQLMIDKGIKKSTLVSRCNAFVKNSKYKTFTNFVKAFRAKHKRTKKFNLKL